jgi:pimeloyl-ACP methyl ester carboxylesterase
MLPRIQTDSVILDYNEAGSGLPIVFVSGITEGKEAFVFQTRGLSDRYGVISYDLRGGLKRASDYTLDLLVDDLSKLLDALGIDNAIIAGHSFGGFIAMQFALQHPDRASALVLVSAFPAAPPSHPEHTLAMISSAGHSFYRSVGASIKVHLAHLLGSRASEIRTMENEVEAVRAVAQQAKKLPRRTINQRMKIVQKTDLRSALPEIMAPTLIIVGAQDRSFFLSSAQELYEGIPDAALEIMEEGGHFCFLTHYDQFNAIIDDFLTPRLAKIA